MNDLHMGGAIVDSPRPTLENPYAPPTEPRQEPVEVTQPARRGRAGWFAVGVVALILLMTFPQIWMVAILMMFGITAGVGEWMERTATPPAGKLQ